MSKKELSESAKRLLANSLSRGLRPRIKSMDKRHIDAMSGKPGPLTYYELGVFVKNVPKGGCTTGTTMRPGQSIDNLDDWLFVARAVDPEATGVRIPERFVQQASKEPEPEWSEGDVEVAEAIDRFLRE